MSRFKIGQKVVCVKSHSQGKVIKGKFYIVKGFISNVCKCDDSIDVGSPCGYAEGWNHCTDCNTNLSIFSNAWYIATELFAPLQEDGSTKSLTKEIIEEGVLEELKLEELELN